MATETSSSADEGTSNGIAPVGRLIRKMIDDRGSSQSRVVSDIARLHRDVPMSAATLSRIITGTKAAAPQQLFAICAVLDHSDLYPQLLRLSDPSEEKPTATPAETREAPSYTFLQKAVIGAFVALILTVVTVALSRNEASDTQADAGKEPSSDSVGTASCSDYTVTPEDLWLRDEYSATQVQLPHGTKVTVESTKNPHGLKLWQVTTEDHQTGWVDYGYLAPDC
jgi:hypothetical protein